MVNTEDLCDAHEAAELLGLSHPNSVFLYMRRHQDLPRPVIDLGQRRASLWLRPDLVEWTQRRTARAPR